MFEKAARWKLRFSYKGQSSTEDLWDLSVRDLDTIYKGLNAKLKAHAEESLLGEKSWSDTTLELKINIVKHIVSVKLAEQKEQENMQLKAAYKQKLLGIKAEKQDAELRDLPVKDIDKLLNDL